MSPRPFQSDARSRRPSPAGGAANAWLGLVLGPAFFGVAAWLAFGPPVTVIPVTHDASVPASRITMEPRRQILGDPPSITINNFKRVCADCHALFPLQREEIPQRQQHAHIRLEHGINDRCHNCHDLTDMNRLVLYSGDSISYGEVPHLCQKCHGPTYKDWERGIHGRVNGYWNERLGPPRKLECIECHDPHQPRHPAMDPLAPLPGPNTLRMRPASPATSPHVPAVEADPLRRALLRPLEHDSDHRSPR